MSGTSFDVVVPSLGRPQLELCLLALACGDGPAPERVVVVDDRPEDAASAPLVRAQVEVALDGRLRVVRGRAAGPAAARNAGWRACDAEWVCFLDDDVVPAPDWRAAVSRDLAAAGPRVGGSQGRLRVPLPKDRRPTDWERQVAGLADARWATADMAFRRAALEQVGGFDERFPRAYREDADLALRVLDAGWTLEQGARRTTHPVLDAPWTASLKRQKGNADDPLMRALHGDDWRAKAEAPPGRLARHAQVTAAAAGTLALLAARSPKPAAALAAAWAAGTAEFAWARIAPGPRDREEVRAMVLTSAAIPPLAVFWHLVGRATLRRRLSNQQVSDRASTHTPRGHASMHDLTPVSAVLFDRDDTLVVDVPFNGDPARVAPMPGAREALRRVRDAGLKTAIVSNQSGIAKGLISREQADAVMAEVDAQLGPFDAIVYCPHDDADGCTCRKPLPGLVEEAAAQLGVDPRACVVIGDIGADVEAARAAGARGVLVPTRRTRRAEVDAAPEVATSLLDAVRRVLSTPTHPQEVAA